MPIDPVSGAAGNVAAVSQNEFLKLLVTQLQYQDPFKPVDNKDFIVQMAQFSALAQTQQINENVANVVGFQTQAQSIALLGKTVEFEDVTGAVSSGTVNQIDFSQGNPTLAVMVGGVALTTTLARIRSVK